MAKALFSTLLKKKKASTPIMPYNLPSTRCPLLSTPRCANTVSCPYRATMDIHQLINSDV